MKKKYKATAALAISIAGAVGTTGIAQSGFLGGMVHNGFLAATIGGLADWFAITALFRKPLGISYRTEIIVRNRQRIMQAVVDFAANDLLAVNNIMKFVDRQDLSSLLAAFVQKYGREKLLPHIAGIASLVEKELCTGSMASLAAPALRGLATDRLLEQIAKDILGGISDREQARRLLYLLAEGLGELLKDEGLQRLLAENIEELLTEYGNAVSSRAFLIGMLGLSGDKLAEQLEKKLSAWLSELKENPESEARVVDWLSDKLKSLSDNEHVVKLLANMMSDKLTEERFRTMLQELFDKVQSEEILSKHLAGLVQEYLARFLAEPAWQKQADIWLKGWLAAELGRHHEIIADMIAERLGQLSNKELVEFTENKVADDLQMIRINGSVVGSLVGMALYSVVYLAGQVLMP